ncbi:MULTISPECIES: LysR substrate-binding domain-containing protein [unclassified Achromobacter]|uniref:LysR substrate-binding domain-containing protein n=1 Tax=unclassified Achromobacter TaxID=2626865 RepID=UPI000B518540|nr:MULTISPECIES: LysR substrate-binding domain-containing protein [unclassified Achromobacter]OWT80511.1 LysR family transcriptional regulator [Achromobacter sp. HZ34]OWT82394.1 LysR family transcriptional regulator [Achromobacter sp. HZ28]
MHFDLTDLRLFLHTVDAGSITAGAARAHLALASASARLRALEDSLGTPLLARGRRGVTPTPAGQALAYHARGVLQQVDRMQDDLSDYAGGLRGRVRLLCNTAAISEYLPEPLGAFLCGHPNIDVDLEERASHRIVPELHAGSADVGIVSDAVSLQGLETFPFRRDRLVLMVPADHPLAGTKRADFADTLAHNHVGLAQASAIAAYLDDQAARAGQRLRVRVRVNNYDAMARMVVQGVGVAVLPRPAALRRRGARVLILELTDAWADRQLMLCVRNWDSLPQYAQALVRALMQDAAQDPRQDPRQDPARAAAQALSRPPGA